MKGKKVVKNKKIKSLSKCIIMNSWIKFSVWRPSPPTARFNSNHVSPLTLLCNVQYVQNKKYNNDDKDGDGTMKANHSAKS